MTQEDKDLLLKYLCAALPYGVIVDYKENEFELPHWKITTIYPETLGGWIGYNKRVGAGSESGSRPFKIGDTKPYLRTMSSMTDEEFTELHNICPHSTFNKTNVRTWVVGLDGSEYGRITRVNEMCIFINWLIKNHFDFMDLIPKGLAIEVTESNNPYKE